MYNKDFIVWLRRNCLINYTELDGKYDYYWCLAFEAAKMWDGIHDAELQFYTDEQMFEIYKETFNN